MCHTDNFILTLNASAASFLYLLQTLVIMASDSQHLNISEDKKTNDQIEPSTPLIYSQQPTQHTVLGSPKLENVSEKYKIFNPDLYLSSKLYGYDYTDLHDDLEKQHYCGVYGWDNACYWGIAEKKARTDLTKHYTKRHAVWSIHSFSLRPRCTVIH